MDFYQEIIDHCSQPVAAEVRALQPGAPDGADILLDLMETRGLSVDCNRAVLGYLAGRLGNTATLGFVTDYFYYANQLAEGNAPEVREAIGRAALAVDFGQMPDAAVSVFTALRANRIDIRPALGRTFSEDWSFSSPADPTWQYYIYLADLGTPGAIEALAAKIATTLYGNDVALLLSSLATVHREEARRVLESYLDDQRHADGVNGPGLSIAMTVKLLLEE